MSEINLTELEQQKIQDLILELRHLSYLALEEDITHDKDLELFRRFALDGGLTTDPGICVYLMRTVLRKLENYVTLEEVEFFLVEGNGRYGPKVTIPLVDVDVDYTPLEEIKRFEEFFVNEDIETEPVIVSTASLLKQFDTEEQSVSSNFMIESFSRSYPSKVKWSHKDFTTRASVKKFCLKVQAKLRSYPNKDVSWRLSAVMKSRYAYEVYQQHSDYLRKYFSEEVTELHKRWLTANVGSSTIVCRSVSVELDYSTAHISVGGHFFDVALDRWKKISKLVTIRDVVRTLFKYLPYQADNNHSSVLGAVYKEIRYLYGYTGELFSSPINYELDRYCSMFDSDRLVGSLGSFFSLTELEGKWVANPPFVYEFMDRAMTHLIWLMGVSKDFSVILVVPDAYDDESKNARQRWKSSQFYKCSLIVSGRTVKYSQKFKSSGMIGYEEKYFSVCDTELLLYSNDPEPSDVLIVFSQVWRKYSV